MMASSTPPELAGTEGQIAAADGTSLHYRRSIPDRVRGLAVVVHGMTEHSGRYEPVRDALCAAGFAFHAFDLRGHGISGGPKGDVERYEDYVDDVGLFCDAVRRVSADLPLFVIGHSLGSLVAAHHAARSPQPPDGLILSSTPAVIGSTTPPLALAAARALSLVVPRVRVNPRLDPDLLSRDLAKMAMLKADPLILKKVTVRMVTELERARRELPRYAEKISVPVLVLHGTADEVASVKSVEVLMECIGSADKTKAVFEGLRHELFNEPAEDRARVLKRLVDWLAGHLLGAGTVAGAQP